MRRRWGMVVAAVLLMVGAGVAGIVLRPLTVADWVQRLRLWRHGARGHSITVDGHRMHYFEVKPGAGPGGTVLLVHGLGARGEEWDGLMTGLAAAGFHVYAPDLLGYGRSDRPDMAYTIAEEEKAVTNFASAMKLSHVDLLGWSMGGWIAMKLAADHPELVDRLVLYDSAGVYFPVDYDTRLFTPTDARGLDVLMGRLTPKQARLPGFVQRDFLRRSAMNAWVVQRSVAAMTSGRDLMEFRLHQIRQPTAVFWGTKDTLIPPSTGERIVRGIGSHASFRPLVGCGHLAPVECEAQSLPQTIEFLREP